MKNQIAEPDPEPARRGRPRDPELAARVFDAALALYGREGWQGLSFEALAKSAGVGKNALYRRWPTKAALLRELLAERWLSVDHIDSGNLRDDLLMLCRMLIEHLAGPLGQVGLRLRLDGARHEAVAAALSDYRQHIRTRAGAIVRRAIDRGELPRDVSVTLVMDVAAGSVLNHVLSTPEPMRQAMLEKSGDYIDRLVSLMLRGLTATEAG